MVGSQIGRTYAIASGEAALVSASEAFEMTGDEKNVWGNIVIPQKVLAGAFANIDDLLAMRIGADNEALRLLRSYWAMLEGDGLTFTPGRAGAAESERHLRTPGPGVATTRRAKGVAAAV